MNTDSFLLSYAKIVTSSDPLKKRSCVPRTGTLSYSIKVKLCLNSAALSTDDFPSYEQTQL